MSCLRISARRMYIRESGQIDYISKNARNLLCIPFKIILLLQIYYLPQNLVEKFFYRILSEKESRHEISRIKGFFISTVR